MLNKKKIINLEKEGEGAICLWKKKRGKEKKPGGATGLLEQGHLYGGGKMRFLAKRIAKSR